MTRVVVIPAFQPDQHLVDLIQELLTQLPDEVVVVNDGSSLETNSIFEQIIILDRVTLLAHNVNMGKGAALKTGFGHILINRPETVDVLTVDADGQHAIEDIVNLVQVMNKYPQELVLGVRSFTGDIPFWNYVGNTLTAFIVRVFFGLNIRDTQSGLRGIPIHILPDLIDIPYDRYEYEMEMLLRAKRLGCQIRECPIRTIYINDNSSSHFNLLLDSMRIYFVLFRYMLASFSTALIDYLVFIISFTLSPNVLLSTAVARTVAVIYNYTVLHRLVFHTNRRFSSSFPLYIALVTIAGLISVWIINQLNASLLSNVLLAKAIAELLLYFVNFTIQKEVIFRSRT